MANNQVWAGRKAYNTLDVSKDIDPTPYAGELFTVVSCEYLPAWGYHKLTVRHDDGLSFPIIVYTPQRVIMESAGYPLPLVAGIRDMVATITYKMVKDFGSNVPQLVTCEPVSRAIVPYGTYAPYILVEQPKRVSLPEIADYPLNGETVSLHTITYHPRGHRARWLAQGKFENHDTPTIHIYGEHERLFKEAGLPPLERDFNRPRTYIVDVVLEWSELYNGYRPAWLKAYIDTDVIEGLERWWPPVVGEMRPDLYKQPKFAYYTDAKAMTLARYRVGLEDLKRQANNESEAA